MRNRTIAIPVAEVIDGGTKSEFYDDLRKTLDICRRSANRAVTACLQVDSGLMTGEKCPKLYTYPVICAEFPGASAMASSIARQVESKYRQVRFHVGRGNASFPAYRSFPVPLLNNSGNRLFEIIDGGEYLTARIKLLSKWWTVRLAGGSCYRDQARGVRAAVKIGDSKMWVDRSHKAILGISVTYDDVAISGNSGTLVVTSGRDCLLSVTKDRSETPFVINGDQAKKWVAERSKVQQRLRQDSKSGDDRNSCKNLLNRVSDKFSRRMDSYVHEVSARVVEYAKRRKVATVQIDFTVKSFIEKFPWYQLADRIKYKCEDAGIAVLVSTQSVIEPDVSKPHVYFKYSPSTNRVKIGMTSKADGSRHGAETDSPEELIILAVDNQPKAKLLSREKHHQSYFASHRVKGEWFSGDEVIKWLREVGWLGNSGNLSQIAQYLDV